MQMKMNYETQRLELKVLPNTSARQVLQFYLANQEIFEKYETDRPKQFYTERSKRKYNTDYWYRVCAGDSQRFLPVLYIGI